MCGICGVVGGDPLREQRHVRAMAAALAHRGPDDEGHFADEHAVLGHRRLTIIDLDTGHQPLANEDETLWITYNGEIYNYRTLRAELIAAGHSFRTQTDTEVILHLYEEYGPGCLDRLRGMFAFAIWDRRRRRLFAARDRFGQKPFYYVEQGGKLIFASEIKGLLAHPDVPTEPEPAAVDYYLSLRFIPPPLTMLRGVRKLAARHWLVWENGTLTTEPYWELRFRETGRRSDRDWIAELSERVGDAVRSHLVSDVPVGAFLSGGIDSSIVIAAMAQVADEPIQTFSVGSDVVSFDETPYARQVAVHCGTLHRERFVGADQLTSIPALVRALDEPSDPIAACMFEAAQFASEHVKVVLGGDGGDEIFAGFDRYAADRWVDRYSMLPRWLREDVVRPLLRRLPESFAYKSLTQRARWLAAVGGESGGRRYARMTSFFRFGPEERRLVYGPELRARLHGEEAELAIAEPFESASVESTLQRMLYTDALTRLPEHTLMLTDRLSMAHGLETRAPLLDHELAEFCATMPDDLKIRHRETKYAMRRVAEAWLPAKIVKRPKQGFMFPVAYWLTDETLGGISHRLAEGPLVSGRWIEREGIERLVDEHRRRRVDHHVRIWMLLNLDAWYRIYLEGSETPVAPDSILLKEAAAP